MPSGTWASVAAWIGNGKSSTTHTLLTDPPVFHVTKTVSHVPAGTVTSSIAVGSICSPPIFAILPQETSENALGSLAVAYADSHGTDDPNARR